MRTDIAENLFTTAGLLTADECRRLIERGEGLGFEAASVAMAEGPRMVTAVRNNDRATFDDPARRPPSRRRRRSCSRSAAELARVIRG